MRIFVTGAHGYVGRHIVDSLSERGHEIVAHARRKPVENDFDRPIAGYAQGDLALGAGIEEAMAGCDAVVHCAARLRAKKLSDFIRDNVTATERLIHCARGAGVPNFVHLSSVVVYGQKEHQGTDEAAQLCDDNDPYAKSKIQAEEKINTAEGLNTVVLRPGLVWGGPFDTRFTGRLVGLLEQKRCFFPGPCKTPMPFTHVYNLAQAVHQALERSLEGHHCYNVTDGTRHSFRDFVEALARMRDLHPHHRAIPLRLVNPLVSLVWRGAQVLRLSGHLPLNPTYLELLNTPASYSIERALSELDYEPVAHEHMA